MGLESLTAAGVKVEGRMRPSTSLCELLSAAGLANEVQIRGDLSHIRIRSITDDSRRSEAGACFVAMAGSAGDDRDHIQHAIRCGAAVVVCGDNVDSPEGVGLVRVRDVRSAFSRLAAAYYGFAPGQRFSGMPLLGVTGTNGKSTTCYLLKSILEHDGKKTALMGTIGYDLGGVTRRGLWTTPPPGELFGCLAEAAERGATHAVMEVSSHSLVQSRCDGLRFRVGVFTNLSGDHLDYHHTMEAYARAKQRLFDDLAGDASAVVNADDVTAGRMVSRCVAPVLRYGLDQPGEYFATHVHCDVSRTRFELHMPRGTMPVSLGLIGRHNVFNALAAAAAASAIDIPPDSICAGLEAVGLVPGRLQRVDAGELGFTVLVDYAHTDHALESVLQTVRTLTAGRLICVFGCGGDRDRSKRPRMARAAARFADLVMVTSDNPRTEDPGLIMDEICAGFAGDLTCSVETEADRRRAIERAISMAERGDVVLIAGKGHEDYQIIGTERIPFDDVTVAGDCIRGRRSRPS